MKKISIKDWGKRISIMLSRFSFPVIFVLGLSLLFFTEINRKDADISDRLWIFFSLGIPLSLCVSLFSEGLQRKWLGILLNIIATALLGLYTYLLPEKPLLFHLYQIFSLGIVFVLSAFTVSFFHKNNEISFWEFSKTNSYELTVEKMDLPDSFFDNIRINKRNKTANGFSLCDVEIDFMLTLQKNIAK